MTDIQAVKAFIDWQEDRRLEGKACSIDDYEAWTEQQDIADRMTTIHELAATNMRNDKGGFYSEAERLSLIAGLSS